MKSLKNLLRIALYTAIAAGFIMFSLANRAPITLSFTPFPLEFELPRYLFGLLMFLAGVLIASSIAGLKSLQLWLSLEKSEKRVKALENEVAALHAESGLQTRAANDNPASA